MNNILRLDVYGRNLSSSFDGATAAFSSNENISPGNIHLMPIFLFLDIAAAFPSLSHQFSFLVLRALNAPV